MTILRRLSPLTALVLVATLLFTASPSSANHVPPNDSCLPFPWESETQLSLLPLFSPNGNDCWRPVIWPGTGHLLTRQQLAAFIDDLDDPGIGYDGNFIWYAPQETVRISDYAHRSWAGCDDTPNQTLEFCQSINVSNLGYYFDLTKDPTMTVLKWGQDWIPLVCANYLVRVESDSPVPTIPIDKFIDENRNGVIDGNDITTGPKVTGVEFEIWRTSSPSWVGQGTGYIESVFTDGNGDAVFRLDGHGPGTYEIREVVPAGSTPTTASVRTVVVDAGIGDKTFPVQRFGNGPKWVDVEKVEFEVSASAPSELDARTDTTITVDLTIRNNGPADHVPVRDTIVASSPNQDCVFRDPDYEITTTLRRGESYSESVDFIVNCDLPSDHAFVFDDQLDVLDDRLMESDESNNTATTRHDAPVIATTDLSIDADIDCPAETTVDTDVVCGVTLDVTNAGYGPVEADVDWTVTGLLDCTITPALSAERLWLDDGETRTITADHVVNCGDRSFHPFTVDAEISAVDIHVEEPDLTNNTASDTDTVEVFEDADLAVVETDLWLTCDEYFAGDPFTCSAIVPVTNLGPAPNVITLTTASLTAEGCVASPDPQTALVTVDVGQTVDHEFTWTVECDDPTIVHVLYLNACVEPDTSDPHAVDPNEENNCGRVAAVPIDFKPLSDPNTVNLGRGGVTSVAILSSPLFNPILEVDTSQPITFGPTGTEAEATQCATEGEDANEDGYDQDLTCKFRNADLGVELADERVYLIGYLVDGTRFIGTEQVRVI